MHADGTPAEGPIALVEVQGYVYDAKLRIADVYDALGKARRAERLRTEASALRAAFNETFWNAEEDFFALALDGRKAQVRSVASNAAHCLYSGIVDEDKASLVAERLMAPDMFSGWGLRTLSADNPAYNPLDYQRGSVWPHDTLLTAAGLWRYGLREPAGRLIYAILEAAGAFEQARLPELFCGLDRKYGLPIPYAQANCPQAWAAAAPILAAQLFLGILPDAPHGCCFLAPELPAWLPRLAVSRITVGGGSLAVRISRHGDVTVIDDLEARGIEVLCEMPPAPLWGAIPATSDAQGLG
jgi:glycogen debranching enzyme